MTGGDSLAKEFSGSFLAVRDCQACPAGALGWTSASEFLLQTKGLKEQEHTDCCELPWFLLYVCLRVRSCPWGWTVRSLISGFVSCCFPFSL